MFLIVLLTFILFHAIMLLLISNFNDVLCFHYLISMWTMAPIEILKGGDVRYLPLLYEICIQLFSLCVLSYFFWVLFISNTQDKGYSSLLLYFLVLFILILQRHNNSNRLHMLSYIFCIHIWLQNIDCVFPKVPLKTNTKEPQMGSFTRSNKYAFLIISQPRPRPRL